jgi:hypothetical protein
MVDNLEDSRMGLPPVFFKTHQPPPLPSASCGMVSPCKACPVPLTAPWDGGPAGSIDTKHPAWLAPRFISGTGIVVPGAKNTPSNPAHFPIPRKERAQGSARGKMAHPNNLVPQRRSFFYAGASVVIDAFYRVRPGHSPQGAVAARGQNLPPAHFPPAHPLLPPTSCAYRKSGSNLFIGVIRHEDEARNEEPMREVAPFGTSDRAPYPKCGLS